MTKTIVFLLENTARSREVSTEGVSEDRLDIVKNWSYLKVVLMVSAIGACRQILRFLTCFVLMFLGFVSCFAAVSLCCAALQPPMPQIALQLH